MAQAKHPNKKDPIKLTDNVFQGKPLLVFQDATRCLKTAPMAPPKATRNISLGFNTSLPIIGAQSFLQV